MSAAFLIEQLLNGVQFGVMLFLMAAGLTLVFGVMGVINLAHGSLYMVGAFVCATVSATVGSFWVGLLAGCAAAACMGSSGRGLGHSPPLCPRSLGSGAGDLRADPDLL